MPKVMERKLTIQPAKDPNTVSYAEIVRAVLVSPLFQTPLATMQRQMRKQTRVLVKVISIDMIPDSTGFLLPVDPKKIAAVPSPDSVAFIARIIPNLIACCTEKPIAPPAIAVGLNALFTMSLSAHPNEE